MNIVFRLDATPEIGMGHLMRCFALSEELTNRKHKCHFLSNVHSDKVCEKIDKSEVIIEKISTSPKSNQDLDYLINFSKINDIDWVVTDHYDINSEYIKKIKANGFKVLSIDDISQIYYACDLVVNQNIGSDRLEFDADDNTKLLLGPKYVMLRDELLRGKEKVVRENVERILVTLGGIDYDNLTLKVLELLTEFIEKNIEIIVVFGPLNKIDGDFESKIIKLDKHNIRVVFSPENIADIYKESDIAISAGGSSCYELAYFGIPNLIITVSNNQLNIAKEFDKEKIGIYLGDGNKFETKKWKKKISELIDNYDLRKKMSQNGKELIDGKGKEKIVDYLEKIN